MAEINFAKIEKKWQDRWAKEKIFEADGDKKREKFFVSFPIPYINGYQHLGHLYTLMRVEAFARYKRLRGFNVLFPQGWHATGSPIINAAKRIAEKEPTQMKIMESMGLKKNEIKKFEDPKYWIKFFAPEYKLDYQRLGMSVDWRREFYTTSLNPHYDKFIQWQFRKLKEKGYCIKGKFPVVWDPKENVAVGDHARIEGEGVTTQDFIWAKFRMKDSDLIIMAGTTRPDALYGQTHLWIDPNGEYVVAQVGEEKWVVGKNVVEKIGNQYKDFKVLRDIGPKELMGKWARGPLVDYDTYIVPAWFIDASVGSGIVYSALEDPVDLYELKKIHSNMDMLSEYSLDKKVVGKLKPIPIISVSGMGENLGEEIGKEFGITSPDEKDKVELAKGELNRRVFRKGVMKKNCGECAGMSVPQCQEFLKKSLIKSGDAVMFYELTGKVVSRSLAECVVKVVDDQWFIDYGNKAWKKEAAKCLKGLRLYPEKTRSQFEYVIGWLHEWACTREAGLGTKLPWDEKWLIESLSDSTIYMAYYTIAHMIKDFDVEKIDDKFFDYILLGKGKGKKDLDKLRAEFEYWYPMDFRNSGKDLVQNHLTFFMFNHVAIFPKKHWPKGIGANGWVTVDGQKMSKSLGNMIPVRDVVNEFGADAARLTILNGGEGIDDPNWETALAKSLGPKFKRFYSVIVDNYGKGRAGVAGVDSATESRSNELLKEILELMEETKFRSAIQKSFFTYWKVIKDYLSETKGDPNKQIFEELCRNFAIMLSPFCPHIAEELWEKIGGEGFISLAEWPKADESKIKKRGQGVDLNNKVAGDIKYFAGRSEKKLKKVYLYVMPFEMDKIDVKKISEKVGLDVKIFAVNDPKKYDPRGKAKKAKPSKPSVFLE